MINSFDNLIYVDSPHFYVNKFVPCKCGSVKRKHTNYYLLNKYTNDGFIKQHEVCYDCGCDIEFEIKYITTAETRNVEIKNG